VLLATYDEAQGPQLYSIETSGVCVRYFGTAVGKGRQVMAGEIAGLTD
jgi:20S proteasome subunit alpha 7